jgi:hypothetical protein
MAELEGVAPAATETKTKYDFSRLNTLAVVSIATSITGFGILAGIITGHIALAQIHKTHENGRGLAIAGLVIGYASIAIWVLSTVFWIGLALTGLREFGEGGMMGYGWENWQNWGPMMDNGNGNN